VQLDGLNGNSGEGRRNATDEVIDSALRYRVQAPMIDGLLADLGIEGGALSKMGGLIREARDMQSIAKEAERSGGPEDGGGSGSGGGGAAPRGGRGRRRGGSSGGT
jgi:hypothetical protein